MNKDSQTAQQISKSSTIIGDTVAQSVGVINDISLSIGELVERSMENAKHISESVEQTNIISRLSNDNAIETESIAKASIEMKAMTAELSEKLAKFDT